MTENKLREEKVWEEIILACDDEDPRYSLELFKTYIEECVQKARDDLLDEIERRITNIIADEGLDISSRRVLELIEKLRSTVGKEGK